MATGYYSQFDVIAIDVRGNRRPYPLATIIVTNVRTSEVLAPLVTTADGIVVEGSYTGANILVGDIIEFSHATFPGKFRYTLTATQDAAYTDYENSTATFIVQNLFVTTNPTETAELFFLDTADATAKPYKIGDVKEGVTNYIPFQSTLTKTAKLYLISKDDKNQLSGTDFSQASFANVTIPATGGAAFKALFDRYTDVTTTGLTVEPLYTNVIPAGTLTNVGDKILFKYAGKYAANANSKRIFVKFAGNNIADSKTQPADAVKWQIDGSIMKIDADSVRYESEWSAGDIAPVVGEGQIDALDLALDDFELQLSATTPTAAGDATVTIGYAYFVPAAQAEPQYLTFLGETLVFDGSALTFTP